MAIDISKTQGFLASEPLMLEVSAAPAKAKVVREGYQVPPVGLNKQAADFFIDNLRPLDPKQTPRVVTQSIPSGTKVTRGTTVDLVLAPPSDIPFGIFDNVHRDLKQRSVSDLVDTMLQNTTVRQTLLKYDKPEDVPTADKALLQSEFGKVQVTIDEGQPDTGFAAAFNAARGALAFK
jgi:hypothetical protein